MNDSISHIKITSKQISLDLVVIWDSRTLPNIRQSVTYFASISRNFYSVNIYEPVTLSVTNVKV